jgi:hypothetical protein
MNSFSKIEFNLFNPPFLAEVEYKISSGHYQETGEGIEYTLAFLAVPLVLHRNFRNALPRKISTNFVAWVQKNQELVVSFPKVAKAYKSVTKGGIVYGLQKKIFSLESSKLVPIHSTAQSDGDTAEVKECRERAFFVGRWLSAAGTEKTIYALLRVKP